MRIPWLIGAYKGRSGAVDLSETINLFPELDLHGKAQIAWYGRPGLKLWSNTGISRSGRGLHSAFGKLFAVIGDEFIWLDSDGTKTSIGTIETTKGTVSMAHNLTQVMLVDGIYAYIYDNHAKTFTKISGTDLHDVVMVTEQDGYFIVNIKDTGYFAISALNNGLSWSALDTANAEGYPDDIMGIVSLQRRLWLIGKESSEIWADTGGADFPFERISGSSADIGCAAAHTIVSIDNSILMLSNHGQIVRFSGFTPIVKSPPQVDYQIARYAKIDDAFAYGMIFEGHAWYVITFPSGDVTWVYDLTTELWTKWSSVSFISTVEYPKFCGSSYAKLGLKHLILDYNTGMIYELKSDYYTDYEYPINCVGTGQIIHVDNSRIRHSELEIEFEPGVGAEFYYVTDQSRRYVFDTDGAYVSQASGTGDATTPYPQISLDYTDDAGASWSVPRIINVGQQGDYINRVVARRLGESRSRAYRIKMSDPVKWAIVSAYLQAEIINE